MYACADMRDRAFPSKSHMPGCRSCETRGRWFMAQEPTYIYLLGSVLGVFKRGAQPQNQHFIASCYSCCIILIAADCWYKMTLYRLCSV